jgi:hypothetical protein
VTRAVVAAAAVLLTAPAVLASAAPATRQLDGPTFTTTVPAGWHQRTLERNGRRAWFLNSGSGHANNLGLPARGQIGLTIGSRQVRGGTTVRRALRTDIGHPRGAKDLRIGRAHRTKLAGAPAGAVTSKYRYKGIRWVQSNVVAVHGKTVIFLEVDAGPKKARAGRRVMASVRRGWRWK